VATDPLPEFIADIKRIFVSEAAAAAKSAAPFKQPEANGAGKKVPFSIGGLLLEIDTTIPAQESRDEIMRRQAASSVQEALALLRRATSIAALLKEISQFPNGFALDPGSTLSPAALASFPRVQKINVAFWTKYIPTADANGDTDGTFEPARPATAYNVSVKLQLDDPEPGVRYWPMPPTVCSQYVQHTHKKAAARMLATLAHELVHIWFTYKFWIYTGQNGNNTGHADAKICSPYLFDLVALPPDQAIWPGGPKYAENGSRPFQLRLQAILNEIDSL
jgi:hypothetical protein